MPMPAATKPVHLLAQGAADEWRDDHRELDAEKVDLEPVGAARIVDTVERAHLARDVRLEATNADEQQQQPDKEGGVQRQQEGADHHDDRAKADGGGASDQPVGDVTTAERRHIHQRGVELRGVGSERHL
jgi:hypothetical protein